MRVPERLIELLWRFPAEAGLLETRRPLLKVVRTGDLDELRATLDGEVRAE